MIITIDEQEEYLITEIQKLLNEKIQRIKPITEELDIGNDNLYISHKYKKVYIKNEPIELTNTEFNILYFLASHSGQVLSKEQIYSHVWENPYMGDDNIVMCHIRHIREKIEEDSSNPIYIQTVWGIGYRFNKGKSSNR